MAHIYPDKEYLHEVPYSEIVVYDLLKKLPDTFYVFHSVKWVKRGSKWKSTWKENDFLILNKALGGIVLEVKGGEITCSGTMIIQKNTETKEEMQLDSKNKKDPLSQATDGIHHYRNLINSITPDLDERFMIEAAIWFPMSDVHSSISRFPLPYREVDGAILDYSDLQRGAGAVNGIYDFYYNRAKTSVSDEEFGKILDSIASDLDLVPVPAAHKGELDHAFLKLTTEQAGLLDYISEQKTATIQGVAGTGKTLIASEAAKRFGLDGRKVLYLCFNRYLFQDLRTRYPFDNVTYYNINTFIAGYRPGSDTSTAELRVQELKNIPWDDVLFDDVIIDEAQDFENDEIIYFKDLMELRDGHFFVFYDKNQLLTTNEVPAWILNSECKLILSKNCRNTRQIAMTSYNVIDIELSPRIMMIDGDKTSVSFVRGNSVFKLAKIIRKMIECGYDYGDIVILSLKAERDSILCNCQNIDGIPLSRDVRNSQVFFTTSKKFKGLESRAVIIIDIDIHSFDEEAQKRNFYVACSRATQKLALFIQAEDKELDRIAEVINPNCSGHFSSQGLIAMRTQAERFDL